jgi:hypothetical protein
LAEQINEIAAGAAPDIQNPASWHDASPKQLVKKIDIDVAELFVQIGHLALPC